MMIIMIKNILSKKAVSALLIAISSIVFGQTQNNNVVNKATQVIFGWDFSTLKGGAKNFGPSPYPASFSNPNLEVSGLTRGSGVITNTLSGSSRGLGGVGWMSNTKEEAIANKEYFTFTVNSKLNYKLNLSSLSLFGYKRVGFRPRFGMLQYSTDGGVTFSDIQAINYAYGGWIPAIDLSTNPDLQNLQNANQITFRIVNWGGIAGQNGQGVWYFYDQNNSPDLDFAFTGEVEQLPHLLFGWDFSTLKGGVKNYGPSPYAATYADANVVVSGLERGAGVLTNSLSGSSRGLGGLGWMSNSKEEAIANKEYFSFTVGAGTYYKLELTSLSVFGYKRVGFRPRFGMLQYSIDGGNTFIDIQAINYAYSGYISPINLAGIPDLQNIYDDNQVTFRVVNWGGVAGQTGQGVWYFYDQNNSSDLDFAFTGMIKPGSVVWNGASWSNGVGPDQSLNAIIEGPYQQNVDFSARNLRLTTGSLNIQSGHSVTVHEGIYQNSDNQITVESDANLIQVSNNNTNDGKAILVKRNAYVPTKEYAYWSSPVVGQNLYNLYSGIPNNLILRYNTANDKLVSVPAGTLSEFGKGYSIKGSTTIQPNVTGLFAGAPNNGTGLGIVSNAGNRYNLIGNPYPSNLNLDVWYQDNVSNLDPSADGATAYFWDNTNNSVYTQMGSSYSGLNYAVYNFESQTGVAAPQVGAVKTPTSNLKVGQGFIVMVAPTATSIVYKNAQRTGNQNSVFFKGGQKDRFWLQLTTPKGLLVNTAIAYFAQRSNNNLDKFDSYLPNESASDLLYSKSDDGAKLTIQGRSTFVDNDRVKLGMRAFVAGTYKLSISQSEGLFTSQSVYLFDKKLNKVIDLKKGDYIFTEVKGLIDNRFEIIYKDDVVLPVRTQKEVNLQVIYESTSYDIKSDKTIHKAELYDMNGVLKSTVSTNNETVNIDRSTLGNGVYIIKIYYKNGEVASSLVRN